MIKSISKGALARRLDYTDFELRRTQSKLNRLKAEETKIKHKLLTINQWPEKVFAIYEELWTAHHITETQMVSGYGGSRYPTDVVVGEIKYPRYARAMAIKLPLNPKRDPTDWEIRDFLSTARYYEPSRACILEEIEVEIPWRFEGKIPEEPLRMIRPVEVEYLSYIEKYNPYRCIRLKDRHG